MRSAGNYLSGTSISFGTTTSGSGRALALAGVSLDQNVIDAHGGPAGSDWTGGLAIGSGGVAGPSLLPAPSCIVVDASGNLYVGDSSSIRSRKLQRESSASSPARRAWAVWTDGTGTGALFNQPGGIVINSSGVLFVFRFRQLDDSAELPPAASSPLSPAPLPTRAIKTRTGTAAWFNSPVGISVDAFNNLFVAAIWAKKSWSSARSALTGTVTTFAGAAGVIGSTGLTGTVQRSLRPGRGFQARASSTSATAITTRSRKIAALESPTTPAGSALATGSADGTGSVARFNLPEGEATDIVGNILYVADTANSTIRKMTPGGTVTTIAGQAGVQGLTDGNGTAALFNQPEALTVDAAGNIYVADTGNGAIREISPVGVVTTPILSPSPTASPAPAPTPAPSTAAAAAAHSMTGSSLPSEPSPSYAGVSSNSHKAEIIFP